jgi:hypothetical protein
MCCGAHDCCSLTQGVSLLRVYLKGLLGGFIIEENGGDGHRYADLGSACAGAPWLSTTPWRCPPWPFKQT